MAKLTAFAVSLILVTGIVSTAKADTIIFDDGSMYDLQPGESVYVSKGRVWEFSRFQPLDISIEALEPFTTDQADDRCLVFGPSTSCEPAESADYQKVLEKLAESIGD